MAAVKPFVGLVSFAVVLVTGGCGRRVSLELVDGRPTRAQRTEWAVVVHRSRSSDTIPKVRVIYSPVVLGDSVVGVRSQDGWGAVAFTYNIETRAIKWSPLPEWYAEVVAQSTPAFSPDARYFAYVGNDEVTVRSWSTGVVQVRGPPYRDLNPSQPLQVEWQDTAAFVARYAVGWNEDVVHLAARGRVGQMTVFVDTIAPAPAAVAPTAISAATVDTPSDDRWRTAERNIVRLPLSAFPDLPAAFVRELSGCTVPQTYVINKPHNVVHGSFAAKGQTDYAVLCSRNGSSEIRIWWGGPVRCPSLMLQADDRSYLQGIGHDSIGYSRAITTTNARVLSEDEAGGRERREVLEHDAIEDFFTEKGSSIWICRSGAWVALLGAD